jgi:hypothetical protein
MKIANASELFSYLSGYGDEGRNRFHLQRNYYQVKENTIIAPWSIDMGPVGIFPKAFSAEKMYGEWVAESDATRKFSIIAPDQKPGIAFKRNWSWGEPKYPLFDRIHFNPDSTGIIHFSAHHDCVMNHEDTPFIGVLIPLSENRLARFISSGGCGGAYPAQGPEIFVKTLTKE